jgi:hypothetical protein
MISSVRLGTSGFCDPLCARCNMRGYLSGLVLRL